ncbi:MAG: hypothetical protein HKN87_22865 [Saprospiraceae bacterium]|nr:hypothetical protein [Saprospiraceae bacterium]
MKKMIMLFLMGTSSLTLALGQDSNVGGVTEQTRFMSQGEHNAFAITIEGADLKGTASYWENYAKEFKGKTKTDRKTGEVFTDNAKMPDLSANTIDIYARFAEEGQNQVTVFSWFDLGGAYIDSELHPEKSERVRTILTEFARFVAKNQAEVLVELQQKALKDLERDFQKLEKENRQFHKKIDEAKALIAEMESEIQQNLELQAAKGDEMENQNLALDEAKKELSLYK